MEKQLKAMFDFQGFEQCSALTQVLEKIEGYFEVTVLSDEELNIFAAGSRYAHREKDEESDC